MTRETTRGVRVEARSAVRKLVRGFGDVGRRERRYKVQRGILVRKDRKSPKIRDNDRKEKEITLEGRERAAGGLDVIEVT